ncbi:amidohydrolase family protein [Asticcacaulis sp. ZE23SCel15]|uniref:amidohydrolase family protein n=1 Tax=Asticcacaulis sp. ZE23SCel15 TaxID=3059027 RepID=UPI00265E6ADD|nr:amidohydrolase family protein [Asticcacaulis sp. ZE23SCel15]WKL58902.1 amidohydrolase family protein [Asticcacaulis sp. ZE23SCel15]
MVIDAHHHLWQIGHNGHEWPTPDLVPIYRDFGPQDLRSEAVGVSLSGTIVVQSQAHDADTDWLLEVAANDNLILGVVGWVDLSAPDAADRIAHLAQQLKFKGVRPMLQSLADDDWINQPVVAPALEALTQHDLSFDALIFTRHLPAIDRLAKTYPGLRIVIDHGAKPPIAHRHSHPEETRHWRAQITAIARNPNVHAKLSGLVTEMMPGQPIDDLWPYTDHLLEQFGPDRILWGSDWPVVNLCQSYRSWFDQVHHHLRAMPPHSTDKIFSTNAKTFYKIKSETGVTL